MEAWSTCQQFSLDAYQTLLVSHAGSHHSTRCQRYASYSWAFPLPLYSLYAERCEQVETEQQTERVAEAAAAVRWTREINWEIDTDKSHTLRLPGRQLSVE